MHAYIERISRNHDYDLMAPEAMKALALGASQGDKLAKTRLINCCVRFALKRALSWSSHNRDIPFDDWAQEACLGLVEAAEKVKPELGMFTTFARHYIDKNLCRLFGDKPMLRIPASSRWKSARHHEAATLEAVAKARLPVADIAPLNIAGDDDDEDDDGRECDRLHLEQIRDALVDLTARERSVIELRYLSGETIVEYQAIAAVLRCSSETARLTARRALAKIREATT
jgi:RNA polymerase sigma factor (sigma-70 family)